MLNDFQQTVDLRDKMEKRRKPAPSVSPLEKIYQADEADKPRADLNKISRPAASRSREGLIRPIIFILAFLIVGFAIYSLFFKGQSRFGGSVKSPVWYAVKLVDGETFYGQITDTKADPLVVTNVYYNYDQAKEKDGKKPVEETGNLILVKRGKETHGPDGTMNIVRVQVLLMEPLKADSKVLKAILEYEK